MYTHDRKLCITQGNSFTLLVSLTQQIATPTGEDMASDVAETASEVTIYASNGRRIEVEHDTDPSADVPHWQVADTDTGKAIAVTVPAAAQHIDRYGLEIKGATADGTPWRYKAKPGEAFTIVDATSDQHIPDSQVRIYALSASVGIGAVASGAGPDTASEQWVTENFQPKGNYLTREQLFEATLKEMMSIEVITPYNHQAASVPIVQSMDVDHCLLFENYDNKRYEPLVFTVKRMGAPWQEVEDSVTAAGYEIVRHEMVLLRKQKRRKRGNGRIPDSGGEDTYLRKYKRGYIPFLPKFQQGSNPFAGKDFLHNDRIDMLITDFLKYNGMEEPYVYYRQCINSNRDSFITVRQIEHKGDNHHTEYELEVFFRGVPSKKKNSIQIGSHYSDYERRLYKGHLSIDCAISEMIEVKGYRRFYGNAVYGRLNLAVSNVVVDGYMADDITGKHLTLSFIPRYSIANDIGSFHQRNNTQGDTLP